MTAFLGAMPPSSAENSTHYRLSAAAEPSVLPRVIEAFAKLALVPERVGAERAGGELSVDIRLAGLDRAQSDHLASALRRIIGVDAVLVSWSDGAATGRSGAGAGSSGRRC